MQSFTDFFNLKYLLNQCKRSEFTEVSLLNPAILITTLSSVNLFYVGHNTDNHMSWNFNYCESMHIFVD